MVEVRQKLLYKAFGLTVQSELYFPELVSIPQNTDGVDVEIEFEDITKLYWNLTNEPNVFVIKENLVMFQISDIATFSIKNGKTISVSPVAGADEDQIRLLILGTCMSSLLMQRKILPLHGSAVAINGNVYAFVGESGAGKSTIASALISNGYRLLSDDVIAVSFSTEERVPIVTPSYPQQKLWVDSLTNFGLNKNDYRSIFGREDKYSIPVSAKYFDSPLQLKGIFELVKSDEEGVGIRKIEKLESFSTLFSHTFRNFLIQNLGLMEWHFQTSAEIVNKVDFYQIRRPTNNSSVIQLVSTILNTINIQGE